MGSHDLFWHLKHKLLPKERSGVELAVWLPTTKNHELTWFICVQMACDTPLENLDEGYNFASNLISIRGLHAKLWGPKVARVLTLAISKLPFGSPRTKCHMDVNLVKRYKLYYKGEGGGFPQVWAMVSFVSSSCLWLVLAPKVLQLCINHLVLVLCRSLWVVDACHSS